MDSFLNHFRPSSEAEALWLKDMFTFIAHHVCPLLSGHTPPAADDTETSFQCRLSVFVVKTILQRTAVNHTLPVSYRMVSISELVAQQHMACVSNLSWNTNQHRAWVREAELALPGHKAVSRVNLLLIGCLREGRGEEWRLTDASGSVRCECLSLSPKWLNHLVFFTHWNYIPQHALGRSQDEEAGGYVELIGSPVPLWPDPDQGLAVGPGAGADLSGAVGVREAVAFLQHRQRGQRLSVCGRVSSVCPVLTIAGTTFFFFTLTDGRCSVPVLVKDSKVWWSRCVGVGLRVGVAALRVCVLHAWRGNPVLCVSDSSEVHAYSEHEQSDADSLVPRSSHGGDPEEEAEPERDIIQSAAKSKRSKVISYQGVVTEVVSEGAGLYVIDGKVGLCLAYQPVLRRKLRPGDAVELHNVHFLYRPCPDFPPSMLCACLRSSLRVTTFSRVVGSEPDISCPGDGVLPRLLVQRNVGVAEYLWVCHLTSALRKSLVPSVLKEQCVCLLSWKLMELVFREGRGGAKRDIYSEMLDEQHTCPLTQYSFDSAVSQFVSLSQCSDSLHSNCWSDFSLSSLLPPDGSSLTSADINAALAWSFQTLTFDPCPDLQPGERLRRRPLLLVGVLALPTQTCEQTLQLRDHTGAMACVVTETSEEEEGGQRAAFNTAWIGCLVCVRHFTMVTERFLQSDFPSYQHLQQESYIARKYCRVYLQFSLDHAHILSPSVAMVTHTRQRAESGGDNEEEAEPQTERKKRKREEEEDGQDSSQPASRPCVSVVIRVEQKEGVSWRNSGAGPSDKEAGLSLCFSVRAAVIGPVVNWERDPRNRRMMDREVESEKNDKVALWFTGVSVRWFPVLQSGCFYRLVAANTRDPSVLIGSGVCGQSRVERHADSTLHVQSDWRFHTLTRPLLLPACKRALSPTVMSVSEVLDCSSADVVRFQGLISDRISLTDKTGPTSTSVRLTVCDQSGRSLRVYMELSHTPYPPGLLPGNTVLLSAFQRRRSRSGGVYCKMLPVSSVTVVKESLTFDLSDLRPPCVSAARQQFSRFPPIKDKLNTEDKSSAQPPPPPMMQLGHWALSTDQRCTVGRVKGHVVCVLCLQLQWSCSLCSATYTQSCSSSRCPSTSAVFQSKAELLLDDGTGEAHVWFSSLLIRPLLGLGECQWEGLQRALRVRGHIRIYMRGWSLMCDSPCDGALLQYLLCVCSSEVVCRSLSLTCRKHDGRRSGDVKRFSRADTDFMTKLNPRLQLSCLQIH